ncbi:PPOX class F420-dependent oxidoreductase [Kitasatospora saccharophila]|uniref:PPOX class F420-dependent oxidoreductase n=1 Tax=Kitasatospora saccharophila TaxID=407973 RepID=A0ABP5JCR3_9ACTN
MTKIPDSHLDLLERPLFGHLATIRPDGTPQVNPVWFRWDGERLWFTTETARYKYRNLAANPNAALSVNDPDQPYRYLEVRGTVDTFVPDTSTDGFFELAARYGMDFERPIPDAPRRVMVGLLPHRVTFQ